MSRCWSGRISCRGRWIRASLAPMCSCLRTAGVYIVQRGAVPADVICARGRSSPRFIRSPCCWGNWLWPGSPDGSSRMSWGWCSHGTWGGLRGLPLMVWLLIRFKRMDRRLFAYYLMHDYAYYGAAAGGESARSGGADGRRSARAIRAALADARATRCWSSAIPRARIWRCRSWRT